MTERTRPPQAPRPPSLSPCDAQPRGDKGARFFFALLLLAVGIAILGLAAVIIQSAIKGAPSFSLDLITNGPSTIFPEKAGFRPAIIGTLYLIGGVILFVVLIGVGAAVYLEEYANKERWWNRVIELNIQNLAAVPSIIYGTLASSSGDHWTSASSFSPARSPSPCSCCQR